MKKILLSLIALFAVMGASAQETDVTTLDWTQKGQGCTQDFDNPNGGTVFGTDAGGSNLSYVDLSAYGQINLYGEPGQTARLFVNREEIGDKGIIFVEINEEGVGVYDFNGLLALQPTIQYIHLNGVKASAWNTTLNLSKITVSGDPIQFPEDVWICPEGETDVTKLAWVQNAQGCTNNLGSMTTAPVWGTDAGGESISYVDLSNYGTLKVYGPAGQRARFFINREEFPDNFQFFADIDETGVGVLNLASVLAAQEGAEYIHLNGVKATAPGEELQIDGITVVEAPWTCPAGEVDYTTLDGFKDVNNVGKPLNGGDVVYGDQSNGDNYTDVTAYETVKFYGTPGATLRIFANRAGGEGVTVGMNEQRVTIGEDGVGTLNVAEVMAATEKDYCRLSGIKICATWQGATIDAGIVIKGITVVEKSSSDVLTANMTITEAGFATFCAPFAVTPWEDVSAGEVKAAYIVSGIDENNQLVLTKVDVIPAYQPVLLEGEAFSEDLEGVDDPDAEWPTGLLQGVVEDTPACAGDYVLQNNDGKVGFYVVAEGTNVKVPANRAFLQVPNMGPGARVQAYFLDAVTALNKLTQSTSKTIYDLNGRQLKKLQKGVNVVNGVKVLVK